MVVFTSFSVWKTLEVGEYRSIQEVDEAFKRLDISWFFPAREICLNINLSGEKSEVDLVRTSVKGLGFSSGATIEQINRRIEGLKLRRCPAEAVITLRASYMDQPIGERLIAYMEPISFNFPRLLCVSRSAHGIWLDSTPARPGTLFDENQQLLLSK